MNFWQCPHPAQYLKEICDTLATVRQHCFVSMPARLIPTFQKELTSRWKQEYGVPLVQVTLDETTGLNDALASLARTNAASSSLKAPKAPMSAGSRTLAVILPEHQYAAKSELFALLNTGKAVHAAKAGGAAFPYRPLLAVAPADWDVPGNGSGLRCLSWWGKLNHADVDCAIEATFPNPARARRNARLNSWWLRPICRGLAAGDPALVETIYHACPKSMDALKDILAKHELCTENNGVLVRAFLDSAICDQSSGDRPHESAEELWRRGLLDRTVEGDIVLHPAGLLAAKREEELKRLIVRGQMQFFMPLLQEVHRLLRLGVEKNLESDLKTHMQRLTKWASIARRKDKDSSIHKDPFREVSALRDLLRDIQRSTWFPGFFIDAAVQWSDVRNAIAHCNMLTFQAIEKAFNYYEDLLEKCRCPGPASRPGR